MGNVRFLVINVLNDCYICMCLIVFIYVGTSGRIPFKGVGGGGGGGGESETREKRIVFSFFLKRSESVILTRNGINKTLDLSLDLG